MREFSASIPIGIGDLLYFKAMFEPVKQEFSSINISPYTDLIQIYHKDSSNYTFINELVGLLFSDKPYVISSQKYPFMSIEQISKSYGLELQKPELSKLLCKGISLNLIDPYLVVNTKVRYLNQHLLNELLPEFWQILKRLSSKYKIVILGERNLETNPEYDHHNKNGICIYSLYEQLITNISDESIIDLTIPALGITSPSLQKLQQDCLIMNEAKFVIQFGVGGSFCIASSVSNIVSYRTDDEYSIESAFGGKTYPNTVVTKDWPTFMTALRHYL